MILDEAIAELRRVMGDRRIEGQSVASGRLGLMHSEAIATILNAVLDGSLIREAEALVVERAAAKADRGHGTYCRARGRDPENYVSAFSLMAREIRALADPSGVEALAALRASCDRWKATATEGLAFLKDAEAERDALAAKLAAAEARVGVLTEAAQHQEQNYLFLHSAAYDVWKWFEVVCPDLIGPRAKNLRAAVMGPRPYGCATLTTPAEETKG